MDNAQRFKKLTIRITKECSQLLCFIHDGSLHITRDMNKKIITITILFIGIIILGIVVSSDKPAPSNIDETRRHDYKTTEYDQYGGWKEIKTEATGFFRVEKIADTWWLITPEGHAFISKGVNSLWYQYGKDKETVNWLRDMGFNTIGAWSRISEMESLREQGMPYAELLSFLKSYANSNQLNKWMNILKAKKNLPDIFTDDFAKWTEKRAETKVKPLADDPFLIGWWTDNEILWAREKHPLLDQYLNFPDGSPGKKAAEDFLVQQFGTPNLPQGKDALKEARDGFIEILVKRYAEVTSRAIRKYDKNHLILGSRLFFIPRSPNPPQQMDRFEALARGTKSYWDVISVNLYFNEAPIERVRALHNAFQGPVLITEFNVWDAQKNHGKAGEEEWEAKALISVAGYEEQIPLLISEPYIVGYHYFPFSNYENPRPPNNLRPGLRNYKGNPRETLVDAFTKLNPKLEMIHKNAK